MDITPSVAMRSEARKEETVLDLASKGSAQKGRHQSEQFWNRFKGSAGETSKRQNKAHMGFPDSVPTILNGTYDHDYLLDFQGGFRGRV